MQRPEKLSKAKSLQPCCAGTSLDSFYLQGRQPRSLELLEKTVFSFASGAGLKYPMVNQSREPALFR
jgi:hypothetical protein